VLKTVLNRIAFQLSVAADGGAGSSGIDCILETSAAIYDLGSGVVCRDVTSRSALPLIRVQLLPEQ
jgi:hypothetical protein